MTLSTKIQQILRVREKHRILFAQREVSLKQWLTKLNSLIEVNNSPYWPEIVDDIDTWKSIIDSATSLKNDIESFICEDGVFQLAYYRSQRQYVNIGAVGIMREGKSEFIAGSTDLGEWLLPRKSTNNPCTASPINIVKGASPDGKSNIARVYFYTVQGIVDLFIEYLQELGCNPESYINREEITTREALKGWCILHANMDFTNAIASEKTEMQRTFENYRKKIGMYVGRLVESDKDDKYLDFDISEVEKGEETGKKYYSSVSYYESPNAVDGNEVYYCFATKEAQIFTENFNIPGEENVTNIQFLDTPGIGEQKVGIDTLLAKAITKDLDIVIGIRKFGTGASNQLGEKYLFNALRKSMAVWPKSNEWIYFILNAFPGADYNLYNISRERIIENLSRLGEGNTCIRLDESHFEAIDLLHKRRLTETGFINGNPIGELLSSILNSLIPKVSGIDADFYKQAENHYASIEHKFGQICQQIKDLHLPSFNNLTKDIDDHLTKLHNAFANETMRITKITACLHDDIAEFLGIGGENPDMMGLEVAKLFGVSRKFSTKEELFEALKTPAFAYFYDAWGNHNEFANYSFKRAALIEQMKKSLTEKIKWEGAYEALEKAKIDVCRIFMNEGNLLKAVSDTSIEPKEWLDLFINMLENDGNYPHLLVAFVTMRDLSINKEAELKDKIAEVVQKGYHFDKFEPYSFETADDATMAFLESLFNIEEATKGQIEEDFAQKNISAISTKIQNVFFPLTQSATLTDGDVSAKRKTRQELENFFRAHGELIVKGDKAIKQALVEKCLNICK